MSYSKSMPKSSVVVVALVMLFTTNAIAQVGTYSQDFNTLQQSDSAALGDDGWLVSGAVFDELGFKFFYGNFPAPNTGPIDGADFLEWQRDDGSAAGLENIVNNYGTVVGGAFSNLINGQGQAGPEDQYLNTFSDYNCCGLGDPMPEGHGNGTDIVRSNILRETIIEPSDVGRVVDFTFDAKLPGGDLADLGLATSGGGTGEFYIRTLSPAPDFATSAEVVVPFDSLGISADTWSTHTLSFDITSDLDGHFFQYGFTNVSSDFAPTGLYLDNVSLQDQPPGSTSVGAVPEPSSAMLVVLCALCTGGMKRRR